MKGKFAHKKPSPYSNLVEISKRLRGGTTRRSYAVAEALGIGYLEPRDASSSLDIAAQVSDTSAAKSPTAQRERTGQ
ncbi:hypothetical protein [Vibrio vulnificus]|uniref:hypothetical protein n=1 Tax=Vibrio vulnificus TaxID=672 RepID=UPI0040584CC6